MEDDPILVAMRKIQDAKDRVLVCTSCEGVPVITGSISRDTNRQLLAYAKTHKLTKGRVLEEIYLLKGSIDEKAVWSFLFKDPRT